MSIDPSVTARRRSSWRIFFPTILLLVLAVGWSIFWWVAASKAEEIWNEVVERQAARGVLISCKDRNFGGFPFRFELHCEEPDVNVTRDGRKVTVHARQFAAVAQIYQPNKMILEAQGPLTASFPDEDRSVEANWTGAQASLSVWLEGPDQFRLVVDGLDATVIEDGQRQPVAKAQKVEFYARRSAKEGAAPGSFDLFSKVTTLALPQVDGLLGDSAPVQASFDGVITGLIDWRPKPTPVMLRDWIAAGGKLHIEGFRVDRGPVSIIAAGDLSADEEGRLNGKDLTVKLAGVAELSETIKRSGLAPVNVGNFLGVGLAIAGKPTNIDGKSAVEVPLALSKGKIGVAGVPLFSLPRLAPADDEATQ